MPLWFAFQLLSEVVLGAALLEVCVGVENESVCPAD